MAENKNIYRLYCTDRIVFIIAAGDSNVYIWASAIHGGEG